MDLTNKQVQEVILGLVRSGTIRYIHCGLPCSVFSRARRRVTNGERARQKERAVCELAWFTTHLCLLAEQHGVFWSVENPLTSKLWQFPVFEQIKVSCNVYDVVFPLCSYGASFRGETRLWTNWEKLCALQSFCKHARHREVFKGSGRGRNAVDSGLAAAYPPKLARKWANLVSNEHLQAPPRLLAGQTSSSVSAKLSQNRFKVLTATSVEPKVSSRTSSRRLSSATALQPTQPGGGLRGTPAVGEPAEPCREKRRRPRSLSTAVKVPPHKRLRVSRLKPKTLELYLASVQDFEAWAKKCYPCAKRDPDRCLTLYIHELCEDGHPYHEAAYAIFGYIALRMNLSGPEKFALPQSKEALKGWKARFPGKSRAGIDLRVWDVVALKLFETGYPQVAAAVIVQGDTYLRPSEILDVTGKHVIPPSGPWSKGLWGIMVGLFEAGNPTKAGEFDDCVLLDSADRFDTNIALRFLSLHKLGAGEHQLA